MTDLHSSGEEPRRLSAALILGVLIMPSLFVWLLLRRGYSRDVRIGGFAYFAMGFVPVVGRLVVLAMSGR